MTHDLTELYRQISGRQMELVHEEGWGRSDAHKQAAMEVAENSGWDGDGPSLVSAIMREIGIKSAGKARNGPQALYMEWVAENDTIASDRQLAFFTGYTATAFGGARLHAIKNGYAIERSNGHWVVTGRPEPEQPEPVAVVPIAPQTDNRVQVAELLRQAAELLSK